MRERVTSFCHTVSHLSVTPNRCDRPVILSVSHNVSCQCHLQSKLLNMATIWQINRLQSKFSSMTTKWQASHLKLKLPNKATRWQTNKLQSKLPCVLIIWFDMLTSFVKFGKLSCPEVVFCNLRTCWLLWASGGVVPVYIFSYIVCLQIIVTVCLVYSSNNLWSLVQP